MILVTVGTELPFDRLIQTVDAWARETGRTDVLAQIGAGGWKPTFIQSREFIEPPEFRTALAAADLVIAHAGMGTILSTLRAGVPLLVMPRRASLGEHRSEHQLATAHRLSALKGIAVAADELELRSRLDRLHELKVLERIGPYAGATLQSTVRDFILQGSLPAPERRAETMSLSAS